MSGEEAYRPLGEVGRRLEKACADLERGDIGIQEMEELLADIRSLEQRVIVLQYKAMENMAKGVPSPQGRAPSHGTLSFSFGLPEPLENEVDELDAQAIEDRNQISLIDSIEELSAAEKAEQKRLRKARAEEERKKQVSIDQLEDEAHKAKKKEKKKTREKKEIVPVKVIDPIKEVQPISDQAAEPITKIETVQSKDASARSVKGRKDAVAEKKVAGIKKSSINEEVKKSKTPTLAQKLSAKPIDNISKALSVNARVGIVKTLFKGDSAASSAFIETLDSAAGRMAARVLIDKEAAKREWKESSTSYKKVVELTDRRFQE